MEHTGLKRGSLEFERVVIDDHTGCYALPTPGPALGFGFERYVGPFGVSATHAVSLFPEVQIDPWSSVGASVFTATPKTALGLERYVGSPALSLTHAVSLSSEVQVDPWSGVGASAFTAPSKTALAFDQYIGSPAQSATHAVGLSPDVRLRPWSGADGSMFASSREALGFERYIGSPTLLPTHVVSLTPNVRIDPWSGAGGSALTAAPRAALGFEGAGIGSVVLSPTHAVMSPAFMGGAFELRQRPAVDVYGGSEVRPHPWHLGVANLEISATWGSHAIPNVWQGQNLWEDRRDRSCQADFSLASWHRREAKLRRLVRKLRRRVTDLRVEVEEQKAWMAEWMEWLQGEWFASQIAPPHPEDEAFDV